MHLDLEKSAIQIATPRFIIRTLVPSDATGVYQQWFSDPIVRKFIMFSQSEPPPLKELSAYIEEKLLADNCLFFGIFTHAGAHIGNIKFEPIDAVAKRATMGILIGSGSWRGKGVAQEVLNASFHWLSERLGIAEYDLGVLVSNQPAIRAYEKFGFSTVPGSVTGSGESESVKMVFKPRTLDA